MKKVEVRPNTLLYPVPVLLVSSGTEDGRTNIMTAGWTGTVCTVPPMAYVSIRPSRVSYDMIKESGEFVLNLNTQSYPPQIADLISSIIISLCGFVLFFKTMLNRMVDRSEERKIQKQKAAEANKEGGKQ